ncbi:MAG TPA: peptide chain release factor N(5)-glutamine methyltransferase [Thioploca sp.]|nr:MAG: protein-(glutamine-N5) methyltransferase, release factor-specific [Beggiatoa sp. 4572_84]RKZ59297.1 MAG: peptide chain release factor N(5)-glutamine methyltransferase [Gammaproteobacteria bacterium]HDN26970.1 peptide chain release factor N(5)-glutamine methyltransferase [Thioploca sp.]
MSLLSLNTALTEAVGQLPNSDTPRLDAEVLLCHVLGVARSYLYAWPEKILTAHQSAQFQALLARRAQSEPIAYLTGRKEFWSLELQVTENTLIPRPETELLVEQALARLPHDSEAQLIDLGTGTGAIALAIATERPHCRVLATDKSAAALKVAQANAIRLGLHQVEFVLSEWWAALADIKATVIVSNPPYVAAYDPHLSQGDVKSEPQSALVAGVDGLADIRQLIAQSFSHLLAGGWLLLEHGYNQAEAVRTLFEQYGYEAVTTYNDLAQLPRVTAARKPNL